jgi:hypothetical protein
MRQSKACLKPIFRYVVSYLSVSFVPFAVTYMVSNKAFQAGEGGGCTWPGGGDAQGGEGGCTVILCIPPGYATGH